MCSISMSPSMRCLLLMRILHSIKVLCGGDDDDDFFYDDFDDDSDVAGQYRCIYNF